MAIDFLDILMEAKSKKPIKISATDDDQTDYTEDDASDEETDTDEEADDTEDEEETSDEEDEATDYTDDSEEDEEEVDEEETDEDDAPEEDEPTDYTDSEEEVGDGEEEPTDYADGEEVDEPTDYTDVADSEDGSDENGEEPSEDMAEEEEGPTDDEKKNKSLLEDLIRLKEIVGNFIDKTSTINGNDISNVKITNQLTNNLSQLSKQIHNYIVYRFSNETYVRNLYFYNYSVEALNISINMLKKINSFKHNK